MDELEYVRRFRAAVPAGDRDRARTALFDAIAAEAPASRRRRLRLGLLLAVVAITGVAVGSALGVGNRIVELIAGKPARPPIAAHLTDEALAKRITLLFADVTNVRTEDAHGVVAIETHAGPVALWTVPTRDGPICHLVEFVRLSEREGRPHGDSRCMPHPSPNAPIVWTSTNERSMVRSCTSSRVRSTPLWPRCGCVRPRVICDGSRRRKASSCSRCRIWARATG
jgi:hypothetical protein